MPEKQKNPFHGEWTVLRQECIAQDKTWFVFESFRPGDLIWNFTQDPERPDRGHVRRQYRERHAVRQKFFYFPETSSLVIDESHYAANGGHLEYYEDPYRVVRLGRSTFHLYWIEHVVNEPDDYHERYLIRKYTRFARVLARVRSVFSRPQRFTD